MVDHNATLEFMRWFEVPIYGSDGIYVIIVHGSESDTLNFIGTGGALDSNRAIQGNWFRDQYPLGQYSGGDTIQLRIAFKSDYDGEVAEGFYIDDVNIQAATYITDHEEKKIYPLTLEIKPNPFRYSVDIRCVINTPLPEQTASRVDLKIYDVTGSLVRTFNVPPSYNDLPLSINWEGQDNKGRRLAPGIYFVVLSSGRDVTTRKVILIQ